jgi:hypothetical protein
MKNPKRIAARLAGVISAWEQLRPAKSFANLTLAEFKAQVQPSTATRDAVQALRTQLTRSRQERRQSDENSNNLLSLVVNAVKGDPEEGEDGALYAAMGYVPKAQRRSGLTRKGSTTPPVATVAAVK